MGGCCGESPTSLPPSGPAGGDLDGNYPNPTIDGLAAINRITSDPNAKALLTALLASMIPTIPSSLPPDGAAGGDLTGTYPAPVIDGVRAIQRIVTNPQGLQLLLGALPSSFPPNGPAGGDLIGTYPNPQVDPNKVVSQILGSATATKALQCGIDSSALTLVDCEGNAISSGASVATCGDLKTAIGNIPPDKYLSAVNYDPTVHTITFVLSDGSTQYSVDLSDLLPVVVAPTSGITGNGTAASPLGVQLKGGGGLALDSSGLSFAPGASAAPATTTGSEVTTNIIGNRSAILGAPVGWLDIGGGRKLPYWS